MRGAALPSAPLPRLGSPAFQPSTHQTVCPACSPGRSRRSRWVMPVHGARQPGNRQQRARQVAGHCESLPETAGSRRRALPRREDEIQTLKQPNPCCRWHWTMGTALPTCFTMRLEPSWETQRENAAFTETIIARQTHLLGRFTVAVAWSPSMWEPNPPARTLGGWPGGFPPVVHPLAKLAHKLVDQQPRHSHDDRCRHPLTESRGRAGIGLGASRLSRTLAPRRGGC